MKHNLFCEDNAEPLLKRKSQTIVTLLAITRKQVLMGCECEYLNGP